MFETGMKHAAGYVRPVEIFAFSERASCEIFVGFGGQKCAPSEKALLSFFFNRQPPEDDFAGDETELIWADA